jgi:signal transduction histidine kinase
MQVRRETEGAGTWLVESLPPTRGQTRAAIGVAVAATVGFAAVAPFAGAPLMELNAFFPALDAIVFVIDLVTAVLLFAQFSISRSRALLALASGYAFTSMIVVPHALTFAGAFTQNGLLGANAQTGSWIFIFWHLGFSAALLAYAALKQDKGTKPVSLSPVRAIGWSVATLLVLVCALTWLATGGATLLPPLIVDETRISSIVIYPISFTMLVSAAALAILWTRPRSLLHQWLMVVALIYIGELAFSGLLPSVRFSAGFYAGRVFSLATSSIVLIVLLEETMRLYLQLANSNARLQRERDNKLMNLEAMLASVAHEVRQPLTGIATSGGATLRFLRQQPPDLVKAEAAVNRMVEASYRADRVFDNIRNLFGRIEVRKGRVDLNNLVLEALRGLEPDLESHRVEPRIRLASGTLIVTGDRGQLLEVIINLVQNAIEAMDEVDGRRILKVSTELNGTDAITVAVEDTGRGLSPEKAEMVFDPFVTTKPHGMGLGLAICRMIVERHQGQLEVAPANPHGAIFRIILPQTNLPH